MYCSYEDLRGRLEEATLLALCDDDGDGAADAGVVSAAVAGAEAEIHAALGGRYATPLSPAPELIRSICAALAVEALFLRRRETSSPEHGARAEAARGLLRRLARGEMILEGAAARALPASDRREEDKAMRRGTLRNY